MNTEETRSGNFKVWITIDLWAIEFIRLTRARKSVRKINNEGERRRKKKYEIIVNSSKREHNMHTQRMCVCLCGIMNYDGYLSFVCRTIYNGCWEEYGKRKHL